MTRPAEDTTAPASSLSNSPKAVLAHLKSHDDDGLARLQRGRVDRAPPGFSLEPQLTRLFRREMTGPFLCILSEQ